MSAMEIVQEFERLAWTEGNLDAARELLAPDLLDHDALPLPNRRDGADGLLQVVTTIRAGLPDLRRTVDDVRAAGAEHVVTCFTDTGTHTGDLLGIPATGRTVSVRGINVARVRDGRITELRHVEDRLGLLRQLGAIH